MYCFPDRDVLCGFLFCANVTTKPKFGDLQGEVTSFTLYHQNKYLDCRSVGFIPSDSDPPQLTEFTIRITASSNVSFPRVLSCLCDISLYASTRGGHALLEDGSDLGYVEEGTPCGPNMMCLERRCLPVAAFNLSSCSGSNYGRICSDHGVKDMWTYELHALCRQ